MREAFKAKKERTKQVRSKIKVNTRKPEIPTGLYEQCPNCHATLHHEEIESNYFKCTKCNHHFRMRSTDRINLICDTFDEFNAKVKSVNPLNFPGYDVKIEKLMEDQGINEAVVTGYGKIDGHSAIIVVMDSYFMMGSMGSVVGEKITLAIEKASRLGFPLIIFTASGGARMQEGLYSLMQMAKTSGALAKFNEKGGLYITVLTDPTTGGVTASFAMLGDIILAEPNTLVGFAGPRVIEQTIKQKLPEGFQRADFVKDKGFIDAVVDREDLKAKLAKLLEMHEV